MTTHIDNSIAHSVTTSSADRAGVLTAAMVALALGMSLVFTTGFAHPSALHNAAHDTRHALGFPCH
ncbi:putative cobalt transporter subunit (CbtB) [Methyloligella halotolerans]|uniref:Putative cobalt transporter subunit (CbtB) n=1 Tax=Methyloligella halotolerans TaxID=1177755 RepID=A0A1E2S1Q8_9HYPH|nr:CbtB domain-containing protein [Methyloligella halotolerans]ODA68269.1 putative cobalt transporter subunit (CbtB) [Methyloligella halotolerans]